jgi:hypothetical protein
MCGTLRHLVESKLPLILVMPAIDPTHPAPRNHTSSSLLRIESKHFWLSNFFINLWIQDLVGTIPSLSLFRNAFWHCSKKPVRQYSRTIKMLFSWVHAWSTRNHSTLSQTPVWRSRLEFRDTVRLVEGCDSSASIDIRSVHVNFHRKPYRN